MSAAAKETEQMEVSLIPGSRVPRTHRLLPKPAGQRMGIGLRDPRRKRVSRREEFGALPS